MNIGNVRVGCVVGCMEGGWVCEGWVVEVWVGG